MFDSCSHNKWLTESIEWTGFWMMGTLLNVHIGNHYSFMTHCVILCVWNSDNQWVSHPSFSFPISFHAFINITDITIQVWIEGKVTVLNKWNVDYNHYTNLNHNLNVIDNPSVRWCWSIVNMWSISKNHVKHTQHFQEMKRLRSQIQVQVYTSVYDHIFNKWNDYNDETVASTRSCNSYTILLASGAGLQWTCAASYKRCRTVLQN